jgi:hypothetical protein
MAECDVIRIEPDIFIASAKFFDLLATPVRGFAGKLMPLHLPALIGGCQLDFIQGGVTYLGSIARQFIKDLSLTNINSFRNAYEDLIEIPRAGDRERYDYYFRSTADVVLTGALAMAAGIERTNLPGIQVSPYDVLRNPRSKHWTYRDHITAFEKSGALAYHFEGSISGRRAKMTEMLQCYYKDRGNHQGE